METLTAHLRQNVVAYIALFVALGGVSAYAADKIGSDEIARNAIRSKHLKNGQVKLADLAPKARGISDPELVIETSDETGGEAIKNGDAQCPDGKVAIGGGAIMNGSDENVSITESTPNNPDEGEIESDWAIWAHEEGGNNGGPNWDIRAIAVCVNAP